MHHFVAHAVHDRALFRSWEEACRLWHLLVHHCPGPAALCIMPDHVHLLHRASAARGFHIARRAYAQWLARRHPDARLWKRAPVPVAVPAGTKTQRTRRYIHLNPCRARLVADPIAWPLSTHLDAIGMAVPPVRPPARDPLAFHRYVSGDPTVIPTGTDLPMPSADEPLLDHLVDAISTAMRIPAGAVLCTRGPARTAFIAAARALTSSSTAQIGRFAGVSPRSVQRISADTSPTSRIVGLLASDPRVPGLHDGHLPPACQSQRRGTPLVAACPKR